MTRKYVEENMRARVFRNASRKAVRLSQLWKDKKMIGIKEAADELGISVHTLYMWVCLRKIEHVKIGRLVKFRPSAIEDYIKKHTVPLYA